MYNILLSFWKNEGSNFFSIADVVFNKFGWNLDLQFGKYCLLFEANTKP